MPKPIESLTGADAIAFEAAIEPHIAAVLDANGYAPTVELAAAIADDAEQIAADKALVIAAKDTAVGAADSVSSLADRIPVFPTGVSRIPLFADDSGNAALWLLDGLLGALGLDPALITAIVAQVGLDPAPPLNNTRVPLFKDDLGWVPIWLVDGKIDAIGVGPGILAGILAGISALVEPRTTSTTATIPTRVEKRGLTSWRQKIGKIKQAGTGIARLRIRGDSWAEQPNIPSQFAAILHALYGKAGDGFVSIMSDHGDRKHHNAAITMTKANWTEYDASTGAAVPAFGCAFDGQAISTALTTATLSLSGWIDTDCRVFYSQAATGSFRWRIDGGAWTTVTATGAGGLGTVAIAGLAATAHTLEIDTTVNGSGGTVAIFGFDLINSAGTGVIIDKAGNAGLTGLQLANFVGTAITPMATAMPADVVIPIMSTNDYRIAGNTPANLIAQYTTLVAGERAAKADTGFIIVAPAQTGGVVVTPQSQFRDAMYQFCLTGGHTFYNQQDLFGDFATESAAGSFAVDGTNLHLSAASGYRLAAGISFTALDF